MSVYGYIRSLADSKEAASCIAIVLHIVCIQ